MRRVRRKTLDEEVERILGCPSVREQEMHWERYERLVPLCGFGQLGLCCQDCSEGPCRVSPFDEERSTGICGREPEDMALAQLVRLVASGAMVQAATARRLGVEGWNQALCTVVELFALLHEGLPADAILSPMVAAAREGLAALEAAVAIRDERFGAPRVRAETWGMAALEPGRVNVLLVGPLAGEAALRLGHLEELRLVGSCGAEVVTGVPAAAHFGSQEVLVRGGLVQGLVMAGGCADPALRQAAAKVGIPVLDLRERDWPHIEQVLRAAPRAQNSLGSSSPAVVGFDGLAMSLNPQVREILGRLGKLVLIAGCSSVRETQNQAAVSAARAALEEGALVLCCGCAGYALVRAGLCSTQVLDVVPRTLSDACRELGEMLDQPAVPPVLHMGGCWDAPRAVALARALAGEGLVLEAHLPELARPPGWALAVALAGSGFRTTVGPILALDAHPGLLERLNEELAFRGGSLRGPGGKRDVGGDVG